MSNSSNCFLIPKPPATKLAIPPNPIVTTPNVPCNKVFNDIIDHNKPLLYVPLAMDEVKHPYDGCLEWITEELSSVNISGIEMVRTFEEFASKNYFDYCAIFIGGGNTFKLLKGIKDSGAFEKLRT